jgi:replicative DNA helicase
MADGSAGLGVPADVFGLPKRQIALFLRHLWARRGLVCCTADGRAGRVRCGSSSRRLVEDLRTLLLRFGIAARTWAVTSPVGRPVGHAVEVPAPDDQRRFLQEIGATGPGGRDAQRLLAVLRRRNGRPVIDTVPVHVWQRVSAVLTDRQAAGAAEPGRHAEPPLGRVTALLAAAHLDVLAVNDLLWDEVVAVEPAGEEDVYDATVLGTHNFVANGIAVHNSIEQDADMVILLHREDMYERESPRAGEADFIVAKHRNGPTDTITVAFQGHYSRFVDMAQG